MLGDFIARYMANSYQLCDCGFQFSILGIRPESARQPYWHTFFSAINGSFGRVQANAACKETRIGRHAFDLNVGTGQGKTCILHGFNGAAYTLKIDIEVVIGIGDWPLQLYSADVELCVL